MTVRRLLAEQPCERLDVFLSARLGVTRSAAKKLLDGGHITVGGKAVKASRPVNAGEEVVAEIPDPETLDLTPQDIPVDIVYEDEDIAVVNKPQGLTVHAGSGNLSGTLVNALLYRLNSLSSINGVVRPGIVHRIDKDTSGLLVVAKNDAAHLSLSAQIAEKTCRREYLALCEGIFKEDTGRIETYIGRSPSDRVKMAVVPKEKGKYALTEYEVQARYAEGFTLARFRLYTGRTHQIRVHCRHIGHPVVGDPVYGSKKQKFHLAGQLLHACRLELTHPRTGERMSFEAPLPAYFTDVLSRLERGGRV
ncbi:MAG TPA: RluA family pseudouridine synthase [Candidatus Borkfalkia avicola]|uniref:Pseudouridine synthase n=1 Tax=Candidatus Borkfalkia avicola TaxID=2838503 RepID=A0A9D2D7X2_9FIRM|nr:RluA family pseudouridine synthase [Candidatus Borkfalkia avicola]